jgi:hypothetical protein
VTRYTVTVFVEADDTAEALLAALGDTVIQVREVVP